MRYNERELAKIGETKPDLEGLLHHMKPQGKDWSDWYQQPCFKERYFKLVSNLLFYYRVNETEPLGCLVLENCQIAYERPHKGIPFAFSIIFKVKDRSDSEAKHIFSCRCDADVNRWVASLKTASYEYWRSQFHILKTKISMKTGKDPILEYMKNKDPDTPNYSEKRVHYKKTKVKEIKSSFCSHIESSSFYESTMKVVTKSSSSSNNSTVENLITF